MIIVKSDNSQPGDPGQKVVTIYVPKNYNITGTLPPNVKSDGTLLPPNVKSDGTLLQLVVKDRATDEEIVFDNPGDNAFPGSSYHILTIDAGRLEPSTEYEYTLMIAKDVEKIIGRGLLRTE